MPRTPGKFILISAPAKINLYLGVHAETDDRGYHRVDSVMTTISLSDVVAIAPAEELSVHTVPAADVVTPLRPVLRMATPHDEKIAADNYEKEKKAFSICLQKIEEHKLDMQLVSAECAFDGSKIQYSDAYYEVLGLDR